MKEMVAIFRRDFVARRDLLLLAAAVMLIAVLMPLVPGTGHYNASEVRSLASTVLAFGLGWCVAIGLGISVFGADLSAGRLGFYFARPVRATTLWAGKILAILAIVFACEGLVILPALLAEGADLVQINLEGWFFLFCIFVLLPLLLLLLSHALGIMNRARTAWLVLDLVGFIACAVGSWLTIRPLYVLGAAWAVFVVGVLLVIAVIGALAVAGCVGLSVGRTDLRRMHAALSVMLWSLLGAAVAGLTIYGGWLRGFGPSEMDDVEVFSVAPNGGWIEVWGSAPGRLDVRRKVLISSVGDRHVMLPVSWTGYGTELVYSADGGTAVGFSWNSRSENLGSLWWVDLTADAPKLTETLLVVPQRGAPALSPDGSRVALLEEGTLSVYDLASEQLVAAIRLPVSFRKATVLFIEHDQLRLYARSGEDEFSMIRIAEVDLEKRTVEETGRIEGVQRSRWMALNRSAERMILNVRDDGLSVTPRSLRNARDGSLIRALHDRGSVRFLEDGRLVTLTEAPGDGASLLVEAADGLTKITHPLGEADWEDVGGEALPGWVVVGRLENMDERFEGRRYDLVDVDSGEIRPISTGLRKVHPGFQWVWGGGGTVVWYVDSPESNRVFTDRTGALVRWDPETGDLIHIVGGRK